MPHPHTLSQEYVYNFIAGMGYTLTDTYVNSKKPLLIDCPAHGKFSTRFNDLHSGHGCPQCGIEKCAASRTTSYDKIAEAFSYRGFTLVDPAYTPRQKLQYTCVHHPEVTQSILLSEFKAGHGCKFCAVEGRTGELSSLWKGGTTSITIYLRECMKWWAIDSRIAQNNTCFVSGKRGRGLHVHHANRPFKYLLSEVLAANSYPILPNVGDYAAAVLDDIKFELLKLHYYYGHGVVIKSDLHFLFHSIYGKKDTTLAQLYEFKEDYRKGLLVWTS